MNTKIITPGMKLKELRKKYKIKQYELSGNYITRNMISMIETDKAKLNKNTAIALIDNIKKICTEKNICYEEISLDYLLDSEENQAKNISDAFLNWLNLEGVNAINDSYSNYIKEVKIIIDKYGLKNIKADVYLKLGNIYTSCSMYNSAYNHYLISLDSYDNLFNNLSLIQLIINLIVCCNNLKRYDESIKFSNLAFTYMNNIPLEDEFKIRYNTLISYKNLKNYDKVLDEIDLLINDFYPILDKDSTRNINLLTLKGNCFKEKNLYTDALKVYKTILSLCNDNIEMNLVTLCNILELYLYLNDSKNLNKYFDKAVSSLEYYTTIEFKSYATDIYNILGVAAIKLDKIELSKLYFNKALKYAKEFNSINILVSSMENLLNIAIKENDSSQIDDLKNQLLEMISLGILTCNNMLVLKFINYYNTIEDRLTIDNILKFIFKLAPYNV
ncbi:helix-turn-helix domain-containing protein [Clostridium senegalense]|uniref:Helix-turn-helix transcriptional regulator n=1 Tax=Clostridium senegalense TaxID=1465809 RepID=A0A6M0H3M5_9CLOT|nr:helix-turn-helix transcriptional regulator [Clostridium senegalense]NEU05219.1 helix-turn-helix transcriptional regulator [Clostridium senegalense]